MSQGPSNEYFRDKYSNDLNDSQLNSQFFSDYERDCLKTLMELEPSGGQMLGLVLHFLGDNRNLVEKGEAIRALETYSNLKLREAENMQEDPAPGVRSVSELTPQLINALGFIAHLDEDQKGIALNDLTGQVKDLFRKHFGYDGH